ncbi:Dormancy-associated protein-like 3 [Cucurbita argyrosperma subsp. argyrosperma]|uniref:Dormancy-associated protein homolog 3 isoform X2 n=1 Tax=Cucurbita moschata TaxID=3662 RepID=A0A6J1FCM7_CUCMO|nr:dormancy-associated protein homolog 3 isoform X2 [Cucurbita moschata]KAG7021078.1 Dormancy-associated protein-like 3 [Cucurbita argyrosperma subsp. argyrosperma]
MGLLDQLWDDTVAGPRPDSGLGKLRKHSTFTGRNSSGSKELDGGSARSYGEESSQSSVRITRSIMILRPPGYQSGSPPISPAGSSSPASPFSGRESFRFRRRSISDTYTKATDSGPGSPSSPHNM